MPSIDTPFERASEALSQALNATYSLVEYAKGTESAIPPVTLSDLMPSHLEPFLDPALLGLRDTPGAETAYARTREGWMASMNERAARCLADFFAGYPALTCLLRDDTLRPLIAANPAVISRAGITAPSPAAWLVKLVLELGERIKSAAGLERLDPGAGALRPGDRDTLVVRWADVRQALAPRSLPDREQVAAEVDGDTAVATVEWERAREQRRLVEALTALQPSPVPEGSHVTQPGKGTDKKLLALAALARIGPNVSAISREIDVPRTTLLGWPTFRQALENMQAQGEVARRSRRSGRRAGDRDFEADDEE